MSRLSGIIRFDDIAIEIKALFDLLTLKLLDGSGGLIGQSLEVDILLDQWDERVEVGRLQGFHLDHFLHIFSHFNDLYYL